MLLAGSQLDTETLWIHSSLETRPADGQTTHLGSHCGPDDAGHFYSKPCWQTHTSLFKMMSKDFIWLLLPIIVITLWSSYDIGILHQRKKVCFGDVDVFVQKANQDSITGWGWGKLHLSHAERAAQQSRILSLNERALGCFSSVVAVSSLAFAYYFCQVNWTEESGGKAQNNCLRTNWGTEEAICPR